MYVCICVYVHVLEGCVGDAWNMIYYQKIIHVCGKDHQYIVTW